MEQISLENHYVPKCVTKRFTNADGYLHGFLVDDRRFVRRVPKKMFVQTGLHIQVEMNGTLSDVVERDLSRIESDAAIILKRLVECARSESLPDLSAQERNVWDKFFYLQWKRVPDFQKRSGVLSALDEDFEENLKHFEREVRPLSQEEREHILDPIELARMKQNIRAKAIGMPSTRALEVLSQRGLAIVRFDRGERLMISSNPILKLTPSHTNDLRSHDVEAWLPIAPDVMVGVGRERGTVLGFADHRAEGASSVNDLLMKQSSIIASSSRGHLQLVIERHQGTPRTV